MKKAIVVQGLAFGDEGKGSMTEFLTRKHSSKLVVRFNGGPQASHNVVLEDGRTHGFSQFGSGTFAGAATFLSKHMLVDPFALVKESEVLESKGVHDALRYMAMDPECVIVTPFHKIANRMREAARRGARHGSVGLGVGEARADSLAGFHIHIGDGYGEQVKMLRRIRDRKIEEMRPLAPAAPTHLFADLMNLDFVDFAEWYADFRDRVTLCSWRAASRHSETVLFEGAQGVLLDEKYGFAPYNTWTDCTFRNANKLIWEVGGADVLRVGVLRSYLTRHGPGPFPTETTEFMMSESTLKELHNGWHAYMGGFRVGYFDEMLARYAIAVSSGGYIGEGGVNCLAITHMDRVPSDYICAGYDNWDGRFTAASLFNAVPRLMPVAKFDADTIGRLLLEVPIRFLSYGPTAADKLVKEDGIKVRAISRAQSIS